MKTKFRFATAVLVLSVLVVFGSVPFLFLLTGKGIHDVTSLKQSFFSILFGVLFIGSVVAVAWLALRIAIDADRRTITFFYPFRLQSFSYGFDELVGFRYKYLSGKVTYKSLKFRTKDLRTFSVSDFETANLKKLEGFALRHFNLLGGKAFGKLTDRERKAQLRESRYFDYAQAKDIKFYLFAALFLLALLFVTLLKVLVSSEGKKLYVLCTMVVIIIWVAISIMNRIGKLRKITKEGDSFDKK
jgi:hypothetical protein